MKWELDDTTSDGIRFLLIGSGSLLLLRLAYSCVLLLTQTPSTAELQACIAEFRNGYLITDPKTLIRGGMSVGERLALALVLSMASGIAAGLLAYLVSKTWVVAARLGLLLALLWFMYAALLLPPKKIVLGSEDLVQSTRPAVLGELSLPWPATETNYPWANVDRIALRSAVPSLPEGISTEFLEALVDDERIVLASAQDSTIAPRLARLAGLIEASYLRK